MHSACAALVFLVNGMRVLPGQTPTRPLPVGFLRADGIVTVSFVLMDSGVQRVRGSETLLPNGLAPRWRVFPSGAAPFDVRAGAMVHVFYNTEGEPLSLVGQVTDGPRAQEFDWFGARNVALALGRPVPATAFGQDSSASPTRDSVLARLRAGFIDTTARRVQATFFHRTGPLAPSTPIRELKVWRAPIPESDDTLYAAQAERWYDDGSITIFDLWAVQSHGRLQIIRRRGPDTSDRDYKGSPSEEPWAVFRYGGRTMVVFDQVLYLGRVPVLVEVLPGSRVRVLAP